MSNRIYLDYNATTPMSPEVLDFYKDQLSLYANASSLHEDGRRAKKEIEIARKNVADLVNVLPEEIIRIAQDSEFKVKKKNLLVKEFVVSKYPTPAILRQKNGDYLVLLAVKEAENRAMILVPLEEQPKSIGIDELQNEIEDYILVLKHKLMTDEVKFGFKWFFTEILKYKKIVGQVLLGSFVIQLFGLVTPLFTQVILDKVLVHRTISTLNVLAFAFVFVSVFELLLNLARNYIFIHTTLTEQLLKTN